MDIEFGRDTDTRFFYSSFLDSNGDIYFGTAGHGLFKWSAEDRSESRLSTSKILQPNGSSFRSVYRMEADAYGSMWLSTDSGVVLLDSNRSFIKRFTSADGFLSNDFSFGASILSPSGELFFGTPIGYNGFYPRDLITSNKAPETSITRVQLRETDKLLGSGASLSYRVVLEHTDNFVTLHFSSKSFVNSGMSRYKHKLEHFDESWIEVGARNSATYTNLPAGDYIFRVAATDASGIWDSTGDQIMISVLPPPWLSWWAYSIYLVCVLVFFWLLHRAYLSFIVNKRASVLAREILDTEERLDENLDDRLDLQVDLLRSARSHRKTTFSLLKEISYHFHSDSRVSEVIRTKNRYHKWISALESLEENVYYDRGLPVADMQSLIDDLLLRFLSESDFPEESVVSLLNIRVGLLKTEVSAALSIIIYELIENCFKYAFKADSLSHFINISLHEETSGTRDGVILIVRDNGPGITGTTPAGGADDKVSGITLPAMYSFTARMGGNLTCSSNHGTSVRVFLPLNP
ncbi:MAG: triple tyrosine motif-containing protein [Pseudomonadota bacterium]